jgi:hypothetical protein
MLSKIPVRVGTTADPKKKTNQIQVNVRLTDFKNGIGKAVNAAIPPITVQRPNDSREL